MKKVIQEYYDKSNKMKTLDTIPENYDQEIISKYEGMILECKENMLKNFPIYKKAKMQLITIGVNILTKNSFSLLKSGVVIAGFGNKEIFPSLVSYTVDFMFNNKLKYRKDKDISISQINDSSIETFAQDETIDTFLFGAHPDYNSKIAEILYDLIITEIPEKLLEHCNELEETKKTELKAIMADSGNDIFKKFFEKIIKQCGVHFTSISEAIKFLPKEELGTMAESLVNLTSFKKRMSLDEAETVGGPCDVAVISRGDGFIWVKRKHYFRKELNPQFIRNYYESWSDGGEECAKRET